MKKILILLFTAIGISSCNLFIEDDYVDENGFKDVPVHEGNGYDEPVTVQQGDATVTYQYKKNVRVLTPEQQKQWVVYAEKDATGAFIEVHFRGDTPADILPVPGEILVSTITEFFPWGCNHLLQRRDYEDGKYIFQGSFSTFEDTFEDLKIEGQVTDIAEEEYYVMAQSEELLDSIDRANGLANDTSFTYNGEEYDYDYENPAARASRPNNATLEAGGAKVSIESDKFAFRIPMSNISASKGPLSLCLDMEGQKNYYEVTTQFDFSGFNLGEGKLRAKITQTTELKLDFNITGSVSMPGSQRLVRFQPLKGKAMVIGPVVIVFFINIDIELQISLDAAINVTKHSKTQSIYTMDFKEISLNEEKKVLIDEDWQFGELELTGSLKVSAKFHLCMGIYGKILSVRFIPTATAEVNFATPKATFSYGDIIWDITQHEGITFKLYGSADLGVFLDLSLKSLLGGGNSMSVAEKRKKLKELEGSAKEASQYFQDVADEENAQFNPNKKYYVNKNGKEVQEQEGNDEIGLKHTFGPWNIIDPITIPLYPTIGSSTFTVKKQWNELAKMMTFTAEYKIHNEGMLNMMGFSLIPGIQILNGSEVLGYAYPLEGGQNARVEEGKVYQFPLPSAEEGYGDVTYTVKPCYFKPTKLSGLPSAVDKGIPYGATLPAIAITDVDPRKIRRGLAFYDDTWNVFDYDMDIIIALKGGVNIREFGINEKNYIKGNVKYNPKDNGGQLADGRYKMSCTISYETKKTGKQIKLLFKPYYLAKATGSQEYNYGAPYGIIISSDSWYQTYNPATDEKGSMTKFAPMHGGYDNSLDDDSTDENYGPKEFDGSDGFHAVEDGRVRMTIKSIEDEQGRVIYRSI